MSTPRVFSESELAVGKAVKLSAEDSHHLSTVLRLGIGDEFRLIERKSGREFSARIDSETPPLKATITAEHANATTTSRVKTLCLALLKGERGDLVIEKACELGVHKIIVYSAERSIVQLGDGQAQANKLARWNKIALAAAKQCKRTSIPEILYEPNLTSLFKQLSETKASEDRLLCCSLSAGALELRKLRPATGYVHLLVGPEGDLTPTEEEALVKFGFELVNLGPNTLRAETAAIAAVAMAQGVWGSIS